MIDSIAARSAGPIQTGPEGLPEECQAKEAAVEGDGELGELERWYLFKLEI